LRNHQRFGMIFSPPPTIAHYLADICQIFIKNDIRGQCLVAILILSPPEDEKMLTLPVLCTFAVLLFF